eukprot:TRINITY_DN63578_c0_g1_i1.p1 TRINITY_DN63578_c0_g1~~TRINITY_DN63578_c0_g1_i1.p1  ORF type:complete len:220 (-),score=40.80 TRINITY_DN63578_c0_g1_i1:167-826(-)
MQASKFVSRFSCDVDFRVRNTFVEWVPTPENQAMTMKRCHTWDGVLVEAASDFSTGEQTAASSPKERSLCEPTTAPLLKSLRTDNQGMEVVINDDQVKSPIDSTHSTKATSTTSFAPDEEEEEVFHQTSFVVGQVTHGRRPAKKSRRLCSKIIDSLIASYHHDEVVLSNIAWSLAEQHGYFRSLCLKHEIPRVHQDAGCVFPCELPENVQLLWAQHMGK